MVDNQNNGWRGRLVAEIVRLTREGKAKAGDDRHSKRSASMAAGLGPNYASELVRNPEKELEISDLFALCDVLEIDFAAIMLGVEGTKGAQDVLAKAVTLQNLDAAARETVEQVIRQFEQRVVDVVDSNMEAASQRVRKPGQSQS